MQASTRRARREEAKPRLQDVTMYRKAVEKLTWRSCRSITILSILTLAILGSIRYLEWAISNVFKANPAMPDLYMMFPDGLVVKAPMLFFEFSPFEIHQALLTAYGRHGRKLYVLFRVIDHALFPVVYTATLLSLNRYLAGEVKGRQKWMAEGIPMALFAIDICENSGLIYLLAVFEENDKGDEMKQKVAAVTMVLVFFKSLVLNVEALYLLWLIMYRRCCGGGKAKKKAE